MSSEDNSLDIEVPISYDMPDEGLSDYTVTLTDAEETPSGSVVPEPPAYKPYPFALRRVCRPGHGSELVAVYAVGRA